MNSKTTTIDRWSPQEKNFYMKIKLKTTDFLPYVEYMQMQEPWLILHSIALQCIHK